MILKYSRNSESPKRYILFERGEILKYWSENKSKSGTIWKAIMNGSYYFTVKVTTVLESAVIAALFLREINNEILVTSGRNTILENPLRNTLHDYDSMATFFYYGNMLSIFNEYSGFDSTILIDTKLKHINDYMDDIIKRTFSNSAIHSICKDKFGQNLFAI